MFQNDDTFWKTSSSQLRILMILLLSFHPPCHIYCFCMLKFFVLLKSLHASPSVTLVLTDEAISLPTKSLAVAFLSNTSLTDRRVWLYVKQTVALTFLMVERMRAPHSAFANNYISSCCIFRSTSTMHK